MKPRGKTVIIVCLILITSRQDFDNISKGDFDRKRVNIPHFQKLQLIIVAKKRTKTKKVVYVFIFSLLYSMFFYTKTVLPTRVKNLNVFHIFVFQKSCKITPPSFFLLSSAIIVALTVTGLFSP